MGRHPPDGGPPPRGGAAAARGPETAHQSRLAGAEGTLEQHEVAGEEALGEVPPERLRGLGVAQRRGLVRVAAHASSRSSRSAAGNDDATAPAGTAPGYCSPASSAARPCR